MCCAALPFCFHLLFCRSIDLILTAYNEVSDLQKHSIDWRAHHMLLIFLSVLLSIIHGIAHIERRAVAEISYGYEVRRNRQLQTNIHTVKQYCHCTQERARGRIDRRSALHMLAATPHMYTSGLRRSLADSPAAFLALFFIPRSLTLFSLSLRTRFMNWSLALYCGYCFCLRVCPL